MTVSDARVSSWQSYHQQDRQCTYNVTLGRVRVRIVAVGKQEVLYILGVSVALDFLYKKRMRPTVICGLPGCQHVPHIISLTARFGEGGSYWI